MHLALGHEEVVLIGGMDLGNAPVIAVDGHLVLQAGYQGRIVPSSAATGAKSSFETSSAPRAPGFAAAVMPSGLPHEARPARASLRPAVPTHGLTAKQPTQRALSLPRTLGTALEVVDPRLEISDPVLQPDDGLFKARLVVHDGLEEGAEATFVGLRLTARVPFGGPTGAGPPVHPWFFFGSMLPWTSDRQRSLVAG